MEDKNIMAKAEKKVIIHERAPAGGIFLATYIGAAVHFVGNVDGFWNIILALLKAAVWPAFLINKVFDLLRI